MEIRWWVLKKVFEVFLYLKNSIISFYENHDINKILEDNELCRSDWDNI